MYLNVQNFCYSLSFSFINSRFFDKSDFVSIILLVFILLVIVMGKKERFLRDSEKEKISPGNLFTNDIVDIVNSGSSSIVDSLNEYEKVLSKSLNTINKKVNDEIFEMINNSGRKSDIKFKNKDTHTKECLLQYKGKDILYNYKVGKFTIELPMNFKGIVFFGKNSENVEDLEIKLNYLAGLTDKLSSCQDVIQFINLIKKDYKLIKDDNSIYITTIGDNQVRLNIEVKDKSSGDEIEKQFDLIDI